MDHRELRPHLELIERVAEQRQLLLAASPSARRWFDEWVATLAQTLGVSIEIETVAPAVTGVVRGTGPVKRALAFTLDADETRCALRYH